MDHTIVCKTEVPLCTQDQVIQDGDLHEFPGSHQLLRQVLVCLGGLQLTRWMVMGENQPGRIGFEGILKDLLRINHRSADCPPVDG
jgi:hypothetical protein